MNKTVYQKTLLNQKQLMAAIKKETKPRLLKINRIKLVILPKVFPPKTDSRLLAQSIKIKNGEVVLDACSGCGVVAIFAARLAAKVTATDINPAAIINILENAKINNLKNKIIPLKTNLFPKRHRKFDVITINPPYTDYHALDIVEKSVFDLNHKTLIYFFKKAKNYLEPGGRIYLSWANFADFKLIENLFKKFNYHFQIIAEQKSGPRIYRIYELTDFAN
ncbi:MAG: methyltransferase [Patescibacteria group bacterium]|jgi:release factor glutamine methyltransferase